MAEFDAMDVSAESSPAPSEPSTPSAPGQAPSTPGSTQPPESGENRIPLSRFNEAVWRERSRTAAAVARAQALEEQLRSYSARPATPAAPPQMPDGWDPAGKTLRELINIHPEFERIRQLEQLGPMLAQGHM